MRRFEIGARVRMINPESRYRNHIGTVLEVFGPVSMRGQYTVKLICGRTISGIDPTSLESALTFTGPYRVWTIFDCHRQSTVGDGQGNDKTFTDLDAAHRTARGISRMETTVPVFAVILDTHNHIVTEYRYGRELSRAEIFTPRD